MSISVSVAGIGLYLSIEPGRPPHRVANYVLLREEL